MTAIAHLYLPKLVPYSNQYSSGLIRMRRSILHASTLIATQLALAFPATSVPVTVSFYILVQYVLHPDLPIRLVCSSHASETHMPRACPQQADLGDMLFAEDYTSLQEFCSVTALANCQCPESGKRVIRTGLRSSQPIAGHTSNSGVQDELLVPFHHPTAQVESTASSARRQGLQLEYT
jgi:hypothetical protein